MCGIFGVFNYKNKKTINNKKIKKAAEFLNHRGPDSEGYFFEKSISLVVKRLAIVDINSGNQPIYDEDKNLVIIFNGEIYNYQSLKEELLKDGYFFKTKSDTEVILYLYKKYGEKCLNFLNGMFAFAIYDKKRNTLFLARDHFGIKPLYYLNINGSLIFSSEIKSILAYVDKSINYDSRAILDYLNLQFVLGDKTLFSGIKKILPGYYLVVKNGQIKIKKYWDINLLAEKEKPKINFLEDFQDLIKESVYSQSRCEVPMGLHLSGGLDTATICFFVNKILNKKIDTFSAFFSEGGIYNDSKNVLALIKKFNTKHHFINPKYEDFANYFDQIIWYLDEPAAGSGVFPSFLVAKEASKSVKVVLTGHGVDESLGGYIRHFIFYFERLLLNEVKKDQSLAFTLKEVVQNLDQLKNYEPLIKSFFSNNLFGKPEERYFQLVNRDNKVDRLLTCNFKKKTKGYSTFESFLQSWPKDKKIDLFDKILYFDFKNILPALLHLEDRMSMAFSIESRVPFLDKRIIELLFKMPISLKFRAGILKHPLRKIMGGKLPREILERKEKIGFPVPLKSWFSRPLKKFIRERLLSKKFLSLGIFKEDEIKNRLNNDQEFDRSLWGLLCLESWFRTFFDAS